MKSLGFESLFIPEHQLVPPITKSYNHPNWQTLTGGEIPETFAHMPDQFVALATAAPVTKSIKLGTGICWAVAASSDRTGQAGGVGGLVQWRSFFVRR